MLEQTYHQAVLLDEAVALLRPAAGECLVDATLGGGGHAAAFAQALGETGRLIGFDRDAQAIEAAGQRLADAPCQVELRQVNFADISETLKALDVGSCDVIFADLGVSSHQLDTAARGFSFLHDGPLDMRMDSSRGQPLSDWLEQADEDQIARVLKKYGEEPAARRIARAIKATKKLHSTGELAALIEGVIPRRVGQKKHPATRSFQALRIAINAELQAVEALLKAIPSLLKVGGRAGIISFHSLEDRLVKRAFADWARACRCPDEWPQCRCGGEARFKLLSKQGVCARDDERLRNTRARSARLRVVQRVSAGELFNPEQADLSVLGV